MSNPKPSLFSLFLSKAEEEHLKEKLQAPNNLDWLLTLLCRYIRDHVLQASPHPDSPEVKDHLIRRIAEVLYHAILQKLRHQHPKNAHQDDATIVRWNWDRTGSLTNQAMCYLGDCWIEDYIQHPRDTLAARCQRLLPSLARLPNMRGKSALGANHKLFFSAVYEEAIRLLEPLPPIERYPTEKTIQRRKKIFRRVFAERPKVRDPQQARRLFHPVTGEVFFEVSEDDYEHWLFFPKHEIALEIAVRAVKTLPGLSREYLRRILPQLRSQAQRLNEALNRA